MRHRNVCLCGLYSLLQRQAEDKIEVKKGKEKADHRHQWATPVEIKTERLAILRSIVQPLSG